METIFDHGVTAGELVELGYSSMDRESYLSGLAEFNPTTDSTGRRFTSPDKLNLPVYKALTDISNLYSLRNNEPKRLSFHIKAERTINPWMYDLMDLEEE